MNCKLTTFISTFGLLALNACAPNDAQSPPTSNGDSLEVIISHLDTLKVKEEVFNPNNWDRASKIISGIPVEHEFQIDSLYYMKYKEFISTEFSTIKKKRLEKLKKWKANEVDTNDSNELRNVFYPFSGGDFIHLHQLYPKAPHSLMLAIEPVGTLPDFSELSVFDIDSTLHESQVMLRDIFFRSYFITKNMESDIEKSKHIGGILPSILWGVSSSGHDIISVDDVNVAKDGSMSFSPVDLGASFGQGVRVSFVKHGTENIQDVTYLSCDISNKGLAKDTAMMSLLNNLGEVNSFVKAASYLMHYSSFSEIRNVLLDHSVILIQDDTGIPFKNFHNKNCSIRLYGTYVEPVKDFNERLFQADLVKAYQDTSYYIGKLPFSMGYHWGSKDQNQMIVHIKVLHGSKI
ncbi:MAG: hypothetical protein ACKVGT_08820 [Flavobacteriales bacterium]